VILQPENGFKPVPAEGARVDQYNHHYLRALRDGDLSLTPPTAVEQPKPETATLVAPAPVPSTTTALAAK
jgi:hypothetical protein